MSPQCQLAERVLSVIFPGSRVDLSPDCRSPTFPIEQALLSTPRMAGRGWLSVDVRGNPSTPSRGLRTSRAA